MDTYLPIQQHFTVPTYVNRGITFVRGKGVWLYDTEGNSYLDLMSNYGVSIMGHSHSYLVKAFNKQLNNLITLHGSFGNDVRAVAAKKLVQRAGGGLARVYFSSSGAEAVEAALKFAVLARGRKRFITASHGYHGKTLGALSATSGDKYKAPFAPLLWTFDSVPFGDAEAVRKTLSSDTAAVILEPVQGEGGIYPPPDGYLEAVQAACKKHGVLLILDEIQTGCGRTGTFLASQKAGIDYDIVCLGKGLAGGIPIGATLVSLEIAGVIPKHIHTSTFGGNPLACAGIVATLDLLTDNLLQSVRETGAYFDTKLRSIRSDAIADVRGIGLMIGLEIKENRDIILKKLQDERILAIPAGESVVRFLPPYIIEKKHVDQTVKALEKILAAL